MNWISSRSFWQLSADEAVREDVAQQVDTIRTLRAGNERKAKWVTASLISQVVAILLLTLSVGIELLDGTSLFAEMSEWLDGCGPLW